MAGPRFLVLGLVIAASVVLLAHRCEDGDFGSLVAAVHLCHVSPDDGSLSELVLLAPAAEDHLRAHLEDRLGRCPRPCDSAFECDDDRPCTEDLCLAGLCAHPPLSDCADDGDDDSDDAESDGPGGGDDSDSESDDDSDSHGDTDDGGDSDSEDHGCRNQADCDDNSLCTNDACLADGSCANAPVSCDDSNPCTADACQATAGCVHEGAAGGTCDDGMLCTGGDLCQGDGSCRGTPLAGCCQTAVECDDANTCTNETCVANACMREPVDCPEDVCNVAVCDAQMGCATTPRACDDANFCTDDACELPGGCVHRPTQDPPEPVEESCGDGLDNDCDGRVDCGDPDCAGRSGCPGCGDGVVDVGEECDDGNQTPGDGCSPTCRLEVVVCAPGYLDCDGLAANGCETQLGTDQNCSGCGVVCPPGSQCDVGVCIDVCVPGPELCNGFDDDCDGAVDEDPLDAGAPCGSDVGQCSFGVEVCAGGTVSCQGAIGPMPEQCDNLDNDCDGLVDEENPGGGAACGSATGECLEGALVCSGGTLVCTGELGPSPEVCDNLDNDCDGLADEENPGGGAACGSATGECLEGALVCSGGTLVCTGELGPSPEVCDNLDNDCDGLADEENPGGGAACGSATGECLEGALVCSGGTLVCTGELGPSPEVCDNLDNDCDGLADEENPGGGAACGSATGECLEGALVCSGGTLVCTGELGPSPEVCDNLDNDCDGLADEENPGGGAACGSATGECLEGALVCSGGTLVCTGELGPSPEVCDNLDNDCDGLVDEENPGGGAACGSATGECLEGALVCSGGTLVCTGELGPSPEVCDNLDNDCDGLVDEENPGGGAACGSATGECLEGALVCSGGTLVCTGELGPSPEVCDNLDNDCDGLVDEENPGGGAACGSATGECQEGALVCAGGTLVCTGELGPSPEVCDNLDNDCDGLADEENPGGGAACGSATGECLEGALVCSGGTLVCTGELGPSPEVCDSLDNDCDGLVDEENPGGGAACGSATGECLEGALVCSGGTLVCTGELGPSPEVCDNLDNDCDGLVDEENPGGGAACGSATGECLEGALVCSGGMLVCTGELGPSPEVCDNLDNDCDGLADEENPGGGAACGSATGECLEGALVCSGGTLVCTGELGPSPEVCDSLDNDCDGIVDEENPGGGAACGSATGECLEGALVCSGGTLVCTGELGPSPEVCDGLDNDCNAATDETFDLTSDPNHCGACENACAPGASCEAGICWGPVSNFDPAAYTYATAVNLDCGATLFDSTALSFSNWCGPQPQPEVITQVGGPDAVVLPMASFTLAAGSTLRVVGTRPVILAVAGNATVAGTIDANASGTTPGAGGNGSCGSSTGGNGSGSSSSGAGGGGGGGFGTLAGKGGEGGGGAAGAAGLTRGNVSLVPLLGGCGGGLGGGCPAMGGAGGGAVQLSAAGTLTATGTIRANGGMGSNGCGSEGGGTGGGSGGAVLLEAQSLTTGPPQANGGAGGAGAGGGAGGAGSTSTGANGGPGGPSGANGGGGGGGGFGRVRQNTL